MQAKKRLIGRVVSANEVECAFLAGKPRHTLTGPSAIAGMSLGSWVSLGDGGAQLIAHPGSALDHIYALAADKLLDPIHPPNAQQEAGALYANPHIDDLELTDLRHLPFVTIDEVTSKDLDQALCIQREGDGWCVWYAIADAAWFVRTGTALHAEALRRGATCYLPGLVIPMLPNILSEDIVSLNPLVDRRALVFRMSLAEDGARIGCQILRARIRSRAKLDYDGVDAWLKEEAPAPTPDVEALQSLRHLKTVGELRIQQAVERDVVRLRRMESAVKLGSERLRFVAFTDPRNDVERYNEQISLLCNMEGARYMMEDAPDYLQPIFRVHPPPAPDRLDSMRAKVDRILRANGLSDVEPWQWNPGAQSLAGYLDGLPREGEAGRLARAIHRQAMMTNGRSTFTARPGLHHGVGAEAYARFSAPMREIVGVYVHRQCWEKLRGEPLPGSPKDGDDEKLRQAVIDASNRARNLQRSLDHATNRLVLDQLFEEDIHAQADRWRRGTVMGMTRAKVHVQLDEPGIDVKIYRHHLEQWMGERLKVEGNVSLRKEHETEPMVRLGQAVDVRVLGRDAQRDRWVLGLRRS